jgi:two-component system, NarL family, response regulator DegU
MITLFVADDHPLFLKGLIDTIEDERDFQIIGSANDGTTALNQIRILQPKVAILDLDMPQMNGIEVAKSILREFKEMKVILLSMHKELDIIKASMALGIHGYIFKDNTVFELVSGIRTVVDGQNFQSSIISKKTSRIYLDDNKNYLMNLSKMERVILDAIAEKKSTKTIANELFISPKTVENHRSNISKKLNLSGNNSLLKFALNSREQFF